MITPKEAIDRINGRFGIHPGFRALHAKGTICRGTFTPTPEAASLTRAAHMHGAVPVRARFSNAMGDPEIPDYVPDVRGFAVGFELPDGSQTDIVAQTAPIFPVRTPEAFIDLVEANAKGPSRAWKFPLFLAKHPEALPSLKNLPVLKPLRSFAAYRYYAIHAYRWVGADGGESYVRYTLEPEAEVPGISGREAKGLGKDYLKDELAQRLAAEGVRFRLLLQIAGDGDDPDDPVARWPSDRRTVLAGTIELTDTVPEEGLVVFDPTNLTDGVERSGDPILAYREGAYSESIERRMQAG